MITQDSHINFFLNQYNLYYRNLSEKGRAKFVKRLQAQSEEVKVMGKGITLSTEQKMLLLSNVVQLTFGLKGHFLEGYEYIFVYPESFQLKGSSEEKEGVTYTSKIIVVSWRKFSEGHLIPGDGENIFLYQLAQALVQSVYNSYAFDQRFGSYMDTWYEVFKSELGVEAHPLLQLCRNDAVDHAFPRCVELFFEKPLEFIRQLPDTYAHLCVLLNQDTRNIDHDYAYERANFTSTYLKTPLPSKIKTLFKYNQFHWSMNTPFFGVMVAPVVFYILLSSIVIQVSTALLLSLLCSAIYFIAGRKYVSQRMIYKSKTGYAITCLLGFGPITLTLLMLLSLWINFNETLSRHPVAEYERNIYYNRGRSYTKTVTFYFADNFLQDYEEARTISTDDIPDGRVFNHPMMLEYRIATGFLGFKIIKHKHIIPLITQ